MAVDKKLYNDSDRDPVKAFKVAGVDSIEILAEVTLTNGDGAGSIYRIAKIPANYIPVDIKINCEAITGASDNDLGLYETDEQGGAVIDKDILCDGQTLASALAIGSEANGLKDLGTTNLGKTLAQLAGDGISERQAYTLALTANAGPSTTAKAYIRARFINAA